jgi:hypothetical protein
LAGSPTSITSLRNCPQDTRIVFPSPTRSPPRPSPSSPTTAAASPATITAEADAAGLTGVQRAGADACARYLTARLDCLRYDQALAQGWPIATGIIEGACRHLIADRLDIEGVRWGLDGTEAVLTLRAVISNGDFTEYRDFHLAQDHQRLYPGTIQAQYTLCA